LTLATAPRSLHPRQLAPVVLLGTAAFALLPGGLGRIARRTLAGYALLVAGVAVNSRGGWRTVPVLITIHGVWGAGLVGGLTKLPVKRRS
jgi:hypothetical protein